MKKVLLSLGLIGLFTFYAIEQRQNPAAQIQTASNVSGTSQTSAAVPTSAAAANGPAPRAGQLININGTIYLVKSDGLYGFPSMAVFNSWGYSLSNATQPNSAESSLAIAGIMANKSQSSASPTPSPTSAQGQYKDGSYTGNVANAFYGNVQVSATISGGKLTSVQFLQYPNDRGHSMQVSQESIPVLTSEAIAAQSASVDIVSGATQTSQAFQQSLQSALDQAKT